MAVSTATKKEGNEMGLSKVMIGVFVGVFLSALLYEIVHRQDPELVDAVVNKLRNKIMK